MTARFRLKQRLTLKLTAYSRENPVPLSAAANPVFQRSTKMGMY